MIVPGDGAGPGNTITAPPALEVDASWHVVFIVLSKGWRYTLVSGTHLNNTFLYPPGSSRAFLPTVVATAAGGEAELRNVYVSTTCSTVQQYIQYYSRHSPPAGANITVLGSNSFWLDGHNVTLPDGFTASVNNVHYECTPGVVESELVGLSSAGDSDSVAATLHVASLLQRTFNITLSPFITFGTGPDSNPQYSSEFGGRGWPAEGMRFAGGSYQLNCESLGSAYFGVWDAKEAANLVTVAPGANFSLSNTYMYGTCAQSLQLPPTWISFNKNTLKSSNALGSSSGDGGSNAAGSNVTALPQAAPLWPFQLEPSTVTTNSSAAGSAPARLYVNASTVLVSEQETSTLHYLAALQPHALAAAEAAGVREALMTDAAQQLAQLVLGPAAAASFLQPGSSNDDLAGNSGVALDLSQLGPSWQPPINLSAQPVFAAYSTAPGAVRVSWSPTPNGGAMRDTTIGAMDPSPDLSKGSWRSPNWLPDRDTYTNPTFCDTGAALANSSAPLFSPPLLTVGGLSPTTPDVTRAALLANSSYVVASAGEALAMAVGWVQRMSDANGSASSYLPPVILLFEGSSLRANVEAPSSSGSGSPQDAPASGSSGSNNITNSSSSSSGASADSSSSSSNELSPLQILGPIIMAGPVPPPAGLPTGPNLQSEVVPGFPIASARPVLDLGAAVGVVHIAETSGSSSGITAAAGPLLLLQRLTLTNLSAKPLASGRAPMALPLWAFDRPGRSKSIDEVATNTTSGTAAVATGGASSGQSSSGGGSAANAVVAEPASAATGAWGLPTDSSGTTSNSSGTTTGSSSSNSTGSLLVLTSVTLQLPAAEFAALCALARLAYNLPNGLSLQDAIRSMRTFAKAAAASWSDNEAISLSSVASETGVFLAAMSHDSLLGVTKMAVPTITVMPSPPPPSPTPRVPGTPPPFTPSSEAPLLPPQQADSTPAPSAPAPAAPSLNQSAPGASLDGPADTVIGGSPGSTILEGGTPGAVAGEPQDGVGGPSSIGDSAIPTAGGMPSIAGATPLVGGRRLVASGAASATGSASGAGTTTPGAADASPVPSSSSDGGSRSSGGAASGWPQSLHLASYAGWGAVGADLLLVPDAPLDSITAIMATDVGALGLAAGLWSGPSWDVIGGTGNTGGTGDSTEAVQRPPPVPAIAPTHDATATDGGGDRGSNNAGSSAVGVGVGVGVGSVVLLAAVAVLVVRRRVAGADGRLPDLGSKQNAHGQQHQKQCGSSGSTDGASGTGTGSGSAGGDHGSRASGSKASGSGVPGSTAPGPSSIAGVGTPGSVAITVGSRLTASVEFNALVQSIRHRGRRQQQAADGGNDVPDGLVLKEVLGKGSYGTVYEGSWKGLPVAVKTILIPDDTPVAKEKDTAGPAPLNRRQSAVTEAAVCCALSHPNVVSTYHYELSPVVATAPNIVVASAAASGSQGAHQAQDWKLYLVQELCDAGLVTMLAGHALHGPDGAPHLELQLPLLHDVASGMAYLHSRDIIHGDLKPDNVMLKMKGGNGIGVKAMVTDFGLAVALDPTCTHISKYAFGTPFYVAPEVSHEARMTKASDVYSFGVMAWELFTGQTPWVCDPATGEFKRSEEFWATVHDPAFAYMPIFREMCAQCIERDPRARPAFEDLAAALTAMEAGLPDRTGPGVQGGAMCDELMTNRRLQ